MTDAEITALAEAYFTALDARDPQALEDTLTPDCRMSIETHDVLYDGRDAIVTMFAERWKGAMRAEHHTFTHTPCAAVGRIASQFTVTYSGKGAPEPKSNANVFTVSDGRIARIQVYMAGANTIRT